MVPPNFLNPSARLSSPVVLKAAFFFLFHCDIRGCFSLTSSATSPQEGRWRDGWSLALRPTSWQFCCRHLSHIILLQLYSLLMGDTLVPTLQMRKLERILTISSQEIVPKPSRRLGGHAARPPAEWGPSSWLPHVVHQARHRLSQNSCSTDGD